jgi:type I restriction enzyme S subunit
MSKKTLAPKLRFPEFQHSEEWRIENLGNICDVLQGYGFPEILQGKTKGKYPFCKVSDISRAVAEQGGLLKEASNYIDDDELKQIRANPLPIGSTVFAKIGEALRLNRRAITTVECLIDNNVAGLYAKNGLSDSQFIFQLSQLIDLSEYCGGAIPSVNKSTLESIRVIIPSVPEQQKIADCLISLDELIAAERAQLDALKAYKKGLLQALFPAEGERVPALRFPEFQSAGEWEEKKLGELGDVLMCKRIFAEETNDREGVPFFKIGTLGSKPDAFISKDLFEEYKTKYNFPRKGEILITCSGTVGKCLAYDGNDAYYQDSNIVWIDNPTLEISNEFLYSILLNVDWGKLNSTTITRIYMSDLRSLSIVFPTNKKEQQKIAEMLTSLDEGIAAQGQRVAGLGVHKQGLLQGLFP